MKSGSDTTIRIDANVELHGLLDVPHGADGLIVFVHGSGSGRFSPRNNQVARFLRTQGFATLLMDLLTAPEEQVDAVTGRLRFDIPLLTRRVVGTLDWVATQSSVSELPIGLFGASTGAGAALRAAAEHPARVAAVVSRGGRPDLAGPLLEAVRAPTLLLVGANDYDVLALNRAALQRIPAVKELVTIDGATHLFEEPGALEAVAQHAAAWFSRYLAAPA